MKNSENGKYKLDTEKRLTTLETNYVNMGKKIDELRISFETFASNHFEHFKDDLENKFSTVDKKVEGCKSEILDKIEKSRGIPQWATIIFSIGSALITGLIMWAVTH